MLLYKYELKAKFLIKTEKNNVATYILLVFQTQGGIPK